MPCPEQDERLNQSTQSEHLNHPRHKDLWRGVRTGSRHLPDVLSGSTGQADEDASSASSASTDSTPGLHLIPGVVDRVKRMGKDVPIWRAIFELARSLRTVPHTTVVELEPAAEVFAKLMGWPTDETVGEFLKCYANIRPEGDTWDEAVRLAKMSKVVVTPYAGRTFAALGRLAYYLSVMSEGQPFPFPVIRIAESFGHSVQTASNATGHLARMKVIEWADPTYSYTQRRARTARFIGETLDAGDIPI